MKGYAALLALLAAGAVLVGLVVGAFGDVLTDLGEYLRTLGR